MTDSDDKGEKDAKQISRRDALEIGVAIGLTAIGCGGEDSAEAKKGTGGAAGSGATGGTPAGGGAGGSSGGSGGSSGGAGGQAGEAGAGGSAGSGGATSCTDTGGLTTKELMAGIDTIVVVMMENRTFDHILGSLELEEGRQVDGLKGSEALLDSSGKSYAVHKMAAFTTPEDPPHGWDPSHLQFNTGKMDGFVTEYQKSGATDPSDVMGYYARDQLPVTYALADGYVICNRWFASVMGPTFPNRYYMHLATSNGLKSNIPTSGKSIYDLLTAAGISHGYYSGGLPFPAAYGKLSGNSNISKFFTDAAAGTLPNFSFVDPTFTALGVGNDDHPPADMRDGQAFLSTIYQAMAKSPQWNKSLLVITYDEHGGHYDHVAPPSTIDDRPEFQQLGFRVPGIVIGPYVRKGCVNDTVLDHVSVIATLTRKYDLPPLNARVSAVNDLSRCIDPALLNNPRPPVEVAPYTVNTNSASPETWARGKPSCFMNLAKIVEQRIGGDWRATGLRSMQSILENGQRLGAVRVR